MPPEIATAPDPATNTAPTSVAPADAPTEWDFLDTPDEAMPAGGDPEKFDDDETGTEDRVPPTGTDATTAEAQPAPDTAEAKPDTVGTPAPEPEKPTTPPELETKATYFDEFDSALRSDPVSVTQAIIDGMDARQKTALFKQLGLSAAETVYPEFAVDEYEPQGEMEAALKARWNDLDSLPQIVAETRALGQKIEEQHEFFVPHVAEANVSAQIALMKLDALCDALGIELPDPEATAIIKGLESGKATYRDAVRKSVNYQKNIEAVKQRRAPRPSTPGNQSRKAEPIPEGTDMVTIARRLGTLR